MMHTECQKKITEIGRKLKFDVAGKTRGDLYSLASADCVWYYPTNSGTEEIFTELACDDKCKTIPVVAFEIAYSETEKRLRGSISSLQILGASTSVIVLLGASANFQVYVESLLKKFALGRVKIWKEEDVQKWYESIVDNSRCSDFVGTIESA